VQRRKAPRLIGVADLVHSVDSLRLARRFDRVVAESDVDAVDVLVQVNTSGEDAKGGFSRAGAVDAVLEIAELSGLRVHGLMTMAPFVEDEAVLRTTFRRLREVLQDAREANAGVGGELSMGMTNDLRYAVEEGSTMVRIGTALFGERPGYDGN
jgi:pyridoxal phosphate enzyme (YggS family)